MTLAELARHPVNYWAGMALDLAVGIGAIAAGLAASHLADALATLAVAVVVYSFYEYGLHRWLYHGQPSVVAEIHARHHDHSAPLVGAPFFYTLVISALNLGLATVIVGRALAAILAGTILFLYAVQSTVHHLAHRWPGTPRRHLRRGFLARLRHHHLRHHRTGDANYGILFTFWDRRFGTFR